MAGGRAGRPCPGHRGADPGSLGRRRAGGRAAGRPWGCRPLAEGGALGAPPAGPFPAAAYALAAVRVVADGTIRPTLLAFPRRGRLLAGRALAAGLAGTGAALLATIASLGLLLVLARWEEAALADPRLWWSLASGAVTVGLVAALAVGLSAITRGAGLTVALLALWAGILEPLLVGVLGGGVAAFLPFLSMLQLSDVGGDALGLGAPGPLSGLVFPLCLAAPRGAAAAALGRRDATLS